MTTDGGGWTLVAVSSDDGQDTWTWNNRHYWDTDETVFGSLDSLGQDYKSRAHHELPVSDLLFVHSPSGVWAAYNDIADGQQSIGQVLSQYPSGSCLDPNVAGFPMSAGTLTVTGGLCDTKLYFHAGDCLSGNDNGYGPTWNTGDDNGDKCPFDDAGNQSSLGPNDWFEHHDLEMDVNGFASLGNGSPGGGLNTGVVGSGENNMRIYIRNSSTGASP